MLSAIRPAYGKAPSVPPAKEYSAVSVHAPPAEAGGVNLKTVPRPEVPPICVVYLDSLKSREKFLAFSNLADSVERMVRSGGFLSEEDRSKLIVLARDGSVACRVTRRANALVLLHDGWSCQEIANAFFLDDDTIRGWRKLFEQHGIEGI